MVTFIHSTTSIDYCREEEVQTAGEIKIHAMKMVNVALITVAAPEIALTLKDIAIIYSVHLAKFL